MRLSDQVAIVTGAGRNIGEETAKLLAREGARVAVLDFDRDRAERVAAEIRETGADAESFVADVEHEEEIRAAVRAVDARWGGIDILVNNVAFSDNKSIFEITKADWDKVMAITLTAPFLMSKYVAEIMVERKRAGKIVNVGSTSGFFGRSRALAYTTAKGGVANLTRSLAVQLAPHDIRVNAVIPNKIGSPVGKDSFNPDRTVVNLRNRPGEPIDLARAVLFLVSDDADFIVGDFLFVDGGCSVLMAGE